MSTGLRGTVQAGWPVIAVGLAVLGLLTLAIAHPGAGAPSRPAASAGNYGPNPPNIRPLAGQDVLTAIALAIVLTLLLALFFARRRGRNGNGNGNGHGNGNGQEGEVATAGVLAGAPSLGSSAEDSDADLDQTLAELEALTPQVAA
ncbi:MAG: hypothetical protein KGJ23_15970, partial [Euryarchaeota archaeon]|nr:hypothetical protein [Euryarchaeota archaeon]